MLHMMVAFVLGEALCIEAAWGLQRSLQAGPAHLPRSMGLLNFLFAASIAVGVLSFFVSFIWLPWWFPPVAWLVIAPPVGMLITALVRRLPGLWNKQPVFRALLFLPVGCLAFGFALLR